MPNVTRRHSLFQDPDYTIETLITLKA